MKFKKLFQCGYKYVFDSDYRFKINAAVGMYNSMPDEEYLKKLFRVSMGKELDLEHPVTFNEKLQWLKLHNRRPEYTMMVDKYLVRDYIRQHLGEEYLIPLLGVWDSPEEIDFAALPDQFVLKCNHNSGLGMCICKDKSKLDIGKVKKELHRGLAQDYYLTGREWPYQNVPRKIICEKFMTDNSNSMGLTDYKFFCFDGYVDCVMVCIERHTHVPKFYFFDRDWNLKRLNVLGKTAPQSFSLEKPQNIQNMFSIAENLSKNIPFVRIDLYESQSQILFGEFTFFPDSGFDKNLLPETDLYFGNLIKL